MKKIFTITLTVVILSSSIITTYSQSQAELHGLAEKSLNSSDKELNFVYKSLISDETRSKDFKNDLRQAQRSWLSFVDNHMKTIFPLEEGLNPREVYGSSYATEYAIEKLELVGARVIQLKQLNGEEVQVNTPKYQENPQVKENVIVESSEIAGDPGIKIVTSLLGSIVRHNAGFVDKILMDDGMLDAFNLKIVENEVTGLVVNNKYLRNYQDEEVFIYDVSFSPVMVLFDDARITSSKRTLILGLVKRGERWYRAKLPE